MLAETFRAIAQQRGTTVAAVVVAWTLAWPGVTGAIVGARSAAQVDGWIAAASLQLTRDELALIAEAIVTTGAGSGPTLPAA
jgi:aryl-alcohol dehydrogenase-like predicted oxidoreductase